MDSVADRLSSVLPAPCLLDQLRVRIRARHYSIRTEEVYVDWVRRFILFHNQRHPRDMGVAEVEAFLTHLAVVRKVSASPVGVSGSEPQRRACRYESVL